MTGTAGSTGLGPAVQAPRRRAVGGGPQARLRRPHRVGAREVARLLAPVPLAATREWDPGMMIHAHGHNSDHIVFVLEGDMTCGDVDCGTGTHIALDQGDTFGPFVAGPDGVHAVRGDDGRPALVPGRRGGWAKLLAEHGREQAPNPPIDMPDWLEGHAQLRRRSDSAVRAGVGVAAAVPAQRPRRDADRRGDHARRPRSPSSTASTA